MIWWEAFVDSLQKFVTNVCSDLDTVRWIEPYHFPISIALQFMWLRVVIKVTNIIETAFAYTRFSTEIPQVSCLTCVKSSQHTTKLSLTNRLKPLRINATKECNCRHKESCPLQGKCPTESVVYQATAAKKDNQQRETYVGLTEGTFETRYNNQTSSFTIQCNRNVRPISSVASPTIEVGKGFFREP